MSKSLRGLAAATALAGLSLISLPALAQDATAAGTPTPNPSQQTPTPTPPEAAPPADFTVTGSAAIVSQYRFRGLSQSNNRPVVQATFTVAHSSGFYISTWGSSASAGDAPINIGGTEIDVYGGWTHGIGSSGFTVDVGGYGYIYPGATAGNYYEIYGSVAKTYGPVTAKVGANVAPGQKVFDYNFTSDTRHNVYVYGELGGGIPNTPLSIHTHLGHTGGGFDWGKDYFDYTAGITYKWKALAFDISVVGTDVGRDSVKRHFQGYCGSPAERDPACVNSFYRMSKIVPVGSVTASF